MVPKVLTAKELHELPRLTIVFIECFDGEYQAPLPTIFAGMKCYDGSIVDEDGSIFSDFEGDMSKDHFDGSCWRFWNAMPRKSSGRRKNGRIDVMERPMLFNTEMVRAILDGRKTQTRRIVKNQSLTEEQLKNCGKPCYPGDILWVRETWTVWSRTLGKMPAFHYKADGEDLANVKWHPSIHMPKEAARIWLKVTNVKCERLQDISFADIQAEGMDMDGRRNSCHL